MALVNKRIIDLPERAELNNDDYTVVDGSNGGTAKYKLSKMQENIDGIGQDVSGLSQTVDAHGTRLTAAERNIETNADDITDLKEDLSQKAPAIYNTSDDAEVVTFADGADDMPMKSVVLKLVPHQEGSGDPSPDNVRPISGYTAVNVTRCGKNLLYHSALSGTVSGVTYVTNDDGSITLSGTATANRFNILAQSIVLNPGTYVVTLGANIPGVSFYMFNTAANAQLPQTFTLAERTTLRAYLTIYNGAVTNATIYPMLRHASISDPTYEPYQSTTYPVTIPSSAGTVYGGELDVTNGVLRVTYGAVDMGTLTWTSQTDSVGMYFRATNIPNMQHAPSSSVAGNIMCSNYVTMPANNIINLSIGNAVSGSTLFVRDTSYTDVASFKTAMSGVMLVYELTTPTEITLDKTTMTTLLGSNTIWMDADGTIQCDYPADTKLYIDALTAPDDDMIADSNIASGKYFTVNNRLYISTSAIAQGEAIVVGTNCTQTDLATALNALNA